MTDPDQQMIDDYAADRSLTNRNRIVVRHVYLVDGILKRLFNNPPLHELEDLRSAGIVGLIEAADRFDPKQGVTFTTYAAYRVRGAIIDSCRRADSLSRQGRNRAKAWEDAEVEFAQQHGRPPTVEEVEAHLGIRPKAWALDVAAGRASARSTAKRYAEMDEQNPLAYLADPKREPHEQAVDSADEFAWLLASDTLNANERRAVQLRYRDGKMMQQIAADMRYSETYVCMFLRSAYAKLRAEIAA